MKKTYLILLSLFCSLSSFAGTIIYKGTNNEKKFVSEIDILSIDRNIITFKIGKTTRTMPMSRMYKYYDTDINMNLAFEDNSSDYEITILDFQTPQNKKGITKVTGKKAKKKVNSVSFEYFIRLRTQKNQTKNIKTPYFYLYVLAAANKGDSRTMYSFCYPEEAKIKNTKTYNEALMFEQAISSSRHVINPNNRIHSSGAPKRKITIPLDGIGERDIIAMYLVVWGKDEIIHTESKHINTQYNASKNWHLLTRSGK